MDLFFTPLKYQKTVRFSGVFRGYRKGALGMNGLKYVPPIFVSEIQTSQEYVMRRSQKLLINSYI